MPWLKELMQINNSLKQVIPSKTSLGMSLERVQLNVLLGLPVPRTADH